MEANSKLAEDLATERKFVEGQKTLWNALQAHDPPTRALNLILDVAYAYRGNMEFWMDKVLEAQGQTPKGIRASSRIQCLLTITDVIQSEEDHARGNAFMRGELMPESESKARRREKVAAGGSATRTDQTR